MKDCISREEASIILEDVIDTLIEVGNGTTDKMLHKSADKLIKFRDQWFNKKYKKDINYYLSPGLTKSRR